MVGQCFETQDVYGKTAEQLATAIKLFQAALAEYSPKDIEQAFVEHIKTSPNMPKPSDIIEKIKAMLAERRAMRDLPNGAKRALPKPTSSVPWSGMSWGEIERQGLVGQVEAHVAELASLKGEDKAAEYLKFLKGGE